MGSQKNNTEMIEFVRQTTVAITTISEATKSLEGTTGAIKEMISVQNTANAKSFEQLGGKIDGLATMFKYVIAPLIGGILMLVGVKMIFKL